MVKNPPPNAGDIGDAGSIPGLGRSSGGRHGNPLQYPCLENSVDRGTWQATVHEVAKSWVKLLSTFIDSHYISGSHTVQPTLWLVLCIQTL